MVMVVALAVTGEEDESELENAGFRRLHLTGLTPHSVGLIQGNLPIRYRASSYSRS